MTYYLEKEEWKYCSMIKLVHYGISHNGLFFLDGPLEVSNPNCYLGKITPYGGISTMGTHAWNLIIYIINDLVTYLGTGSRDLLILEF